jgi:hypothetical protein
LACDATKSANPADARVLIQEIIRRKRDGAALHAGEIAHFVEALTKGHASDAHAAAFAMAAFLRGLSREESAALARAMARSGRTLDWPDVEGPILDKHSTGGIGDTVSLILAPAVAACGGYVPMIAGRGLGHTGGTIDKLEAIPGYNTAPDAETFGRCVRDVGCAIIGQTDDLAPADKRLYAVARCHGDNRVDPAAHGVDPVEEACRRTGSAGARCEDGFRRLYGRGGAGARACPFACRDSMCSRPAHAGASHPHARAVGKCRRQRGRSAARD